MSSTSGEFDTVRRIHENGTSGSKAPGVALLVARSLLDSDRWDVLLTMGLTMLVTGVGLVLGVLIGVLVGIGSGLIVGGLLFMVGALHGARNSSAGGVAE